MKKFLAIPPTGKISALYFLLFTLISGCAQQPTVVATEDPIQLTKSATTALAHAAYLNHIFNLCSALGGDAEYEAIIVQQDWLDKNWTMISAADRYYSERLGSETINYNSKDIALAAALLSYNAKKRAADELNFKQRTPGNQQKTCVRRIQAIAQGEMDVVQDPQALQDLQTLQSKYITDSKVVIPIPTLAGNVALNQENGRSYLVLLDELRKECPEAQLLVLFNQWPQEAYGAYCGEVPVSLITCEWGQCKQQQ